ncbi:hypothetical protein PR048_005256 [Dryococelus australis]|uniref:DDE-1 domain-containing protein n=1 Tax=Dryococelus australis TaxID=614101 RepID=A0ABQ9I8U0_9NEOP|nr:hypothetical protein PR048_005256 [Dryococelus australis]
MHQELILKLLVVGKSKSPRVFKNIRVESLQVTYMRQSRAWVTKEVFHDWYTNSFVPQVKHHLNEKKNTTACIQSLDQNVIKTLNAHYKKRLLTDIVGQPNADITSLLRQFNMKDAIVNTVFAWHQVKSLTLVKSWKNIWPENTLPPKQDDNKYKSQDNNNDSEPILEAAIANCNEVEIPQ